MINEIEKRLQLVKDLQSIRLNEKKHEAKS